MNFDPINSESDPINDPINELLDLIKNDPYKIYEEYARCLRISPSTVKRMLATLRQQGIIKREGAKKTGHWVVINDPIKLNVDPLNDPINELLDLIKTDPYKIYEEYARCLRISPSTVKRMLATLRQQGIIKREGAKKTGHWEIIDNSKVE